MSATGRAAVRHENDFYETPKWCTEAILPWLPIDGSVLDAGCGTLAIARVVRNERFKLGLSAAVHGIDIVLPEAHHDGIVADVGDFLDPGAVAGSFDLVIMNPPYSLALPFVKRSIQLVEPCDGTVAALLRLNWLEGKERSTFHRAHPSDVYVLSKRPSFCVHVKCKTCTWSVSLHTEVERPNSCHACGGKVSVVTTDATAYAWFVWGPGRGSRWAIL